MKNIASKDNKHAQETLVRYHEKQIEGLNYAMNVLEHHIVTLRNQRDAHREKLNTLLQEPF